MSVELKGASARAFIAGILLLSRGRSFGLRLEVSVVGAEHDFATVEGPALLYSPVLASCGVGRESGDGPLVVVPGPAAEPLAVCLTADGVGPWFWVDRAGAGAHPATAAFVRLCRDPRPLARSASAEMRRALVTLGLTAEPAVLDLLFGAPASPLFRLALALRAGRAMGGGNTASILRFFQSDQETLPDPLPSPATPEDLAAARADGRLGTLLALLAPGVRIPVSEWLDTMEILATEDGGVYLPLAAALVELGSHLASLPPHALLPKLDPAMDAVARGLGAALGATQGTSDANRSLHDLFRFLGGRHIEDARYPVILEGPPPPPERLARWAWLCEAARGSADRADTLWRRVMDPVQ